MFKFKKFREWSKLSKWLLLAGVIYGLLTFPAGIVPIGEGCHEAYAPGCWFGEKIVDPLTAIGFGPLASVILGFPQIISFFSWLATAGLVYNLPFIDHTFLGWLALLLPLILVVLYSVIATEIVGHGIAWLWRKSAMLQSPRRSLARAAIVFMFVAAPIATSFILSFAPVKAKTRTPPEMIFYLKTKPKAAERIPALQFQIPYWQNVCVAESGLRLDVQYNPATLLVEIPPQPIIDLGGYNIATRRSRKTLDKLEDCATPERVIEIDMAWLRGVEKEVLVRLASKESRYRIFLNESRSTVDIAPLQESLVKIHAPGVQGERVGEPATVILYPPDVFRLSESSETQGRYDKETGRNIWHTPAQALEALRAHGIIPVDEADPNLPRYDPSDPYSRLDESWRLSGYFVPRGNLIPVLSPSGRGEFEILHKGERFKFIFSYDLFSDL